MKVLVIDDEFAALAKMTTILQEFGNCDAATSGKQAFEMFVKALVSIHPYDLVTIDIEMPGMDGLTLLRRLREAEQLHSGRPARKIMVSAASSKNNVAQSVMNHADGFLVKPVKRETLLAKLRSIGLIYADGKGVDVQ